MQWMKTTSTIIFKALFAAGARPAQRGEFTKRAFLNGQLALTQAEGDFEKAVEGRIPVAVIPMVDYGRMNAAKILDDVKKMISNISHNYGLG